MCSQQLPVLFQQSLSKLQLVSFQRAIFSTLNRAGYVTAAGAVSLIYAVDENAVIKPPLLGSLKFTLTMDLSTMNAVHIAM